jgi:hypothetical protein
METQNHIHETLNPHSVEISRGQTGKVGFTVKSYGQTTDASLLSALETFEKLCQTFPA